MSLDELTTEGTMQPRIAVVNSGIVVGIVEAYPDGWSPATGQGVPCGAEPQIGWTFDGAAFSPPQPTPPDDTHAAWLRAALAEAGKLDAVDAAVEAAGPVKVALWQYATTIRRDDSDVTAVAAALKIDLAALFLRAEEIRRERTGG